MEIVAHAEPAGRLLTLLRVDGADDAPLWQRSTWGDGMAFALRFDRHHARVHRLAADRHDAADLLQRQCHQ